MTTASTNDLARQGAVVAALGATVAMNTLANTLPLNGQKTGDISKRFPLMITPPGYVFSIWGLIYTGLITYAVYQALPAQRDQERLRRIAAPFIVSCVANSLWLVLWHHNKPKATVPVMLTLLASLITIDRRIGPAKDLTSDERIFVRTPFSIYLGWVSVATIVNITVALYDAGWDGCGVPPEAWTAGLLGTAGGLAATMGVKEGDVPFPLVVAWASSGIARKNADVPLVASMGWAVTALGIFAAIAAAMQGKQGV
ncbi:MAG: tryptophan-rich sensory protein [Candidatus Viridilinea halotolerans]|uniref:Tryptophan-rich sensory protein n=1 Tax=Candidatus Viridilinea halotolerans TaxID=2491704 RepID=A0A426TZ64_9CHLR|nr:MAG: tryptophan-rich sensory protein [Candidatus Viridilinea halotolerans]